jgi:hypothetical protein
VHTLVSALSQYTLLHKSNPSRHWKTSPEGLQVSASTIGIIIPYKTTGPRVSVRKRIIYFSVSLADGFVIEENVWLHTDYTDIKFTNSALNCCLRTFSKHAPVPQTHADTTRRVCTLFVTFGVL